MVPLLGESVGWEKVSETGMADATGRRVSGISTITRASASDTVRQHDPNVADEDLRMTADFMSAFHGMPAADTLAHFRKMQNRNVNTVLKFMDVAVVAGVPVLVAFASPESLAARAMANQIATDSALHRDYSTDWKLRTGLGNTVDTLVPWTIATDKVSKRTRLIRHCANPRCDWLFATHMPPATDAVGQAKLIKLHSWAACKLGLMLCGRCCEAAYCSKECQREHYPLHKMNCHAAADAHAKLLDKDPGVNIQLALADAAFRQTTGSQRHLALVRFASDAALKQGLNPEAWNASPGAEFNLPEPLPAKLTFIDIKGHREMCKAIKKGIREGSCDSSDSLNDTIAHQMVKTYELGSQLPIQLEVKVSSGLHWTGEVAAGSTRVFLMTILPENRGVKASGLAASRLEAGWGDDSDRD